jgi:hypothetical protein
MKKKEVEYTSMDDPTPKRPSNTRPGTGTSGTKVKSDKFKRQRKYQKPKKKNIG